MKKAKGGAWRASEGQKAAVAKRKPGRPRKNSVMSEEPQTPIPVVKKRGRKKSEKEHDNSFETKTEVKEEEGEDGELYCVCKTPYDPSK